MSALRSVVRAICAALVVGLAGVITTLFVAGLWGLVWFGGVR